MITARRKKTHLIAMLIVGALAVFDSVNAQADPFWGAIGGAIEGEIVGGIIGGREGAEIGGDLGAASGFVDGAIRSHERHRRYYRYRNSAPRYATPRRRYRAARPPARSGGNIVLQTQVSLRRLGYNPGPADGQAGTRTVNAVRAYQRANGFRVTGRISANLLRHMRAGGG